MRCPFCEMNVWKVEYRYDVNIISLHCQNCDCITAEIDIAALESDWKINNPEK